MKKKMPAIHADELMARIKAEVRQENILKNGFLAISSG